ncbi:helix-turn-helix transcriptional regulator [Candidatus Obscuribacterales bacterium]|nr:helix-turn-helix transcriptional regulator [Candidatus Obscuribacterales bacterium]
MNTAPRNDSDLACPITSVLNLISAKWTVQILRELAIGPVRTRRFLKVIPGLSMKSLQERLKALQASGMITRQEFDERIPRVEHTITERGRRLFSVLTILKDIEAELTPLTCKCSLEGNSEAEMDCPMRRAPILKCKSTSD